MKNALLVLEDGTVLRGKGFGSECESWGELVFNTGMSGYVEAITDPSYSGQILMFTYPLIGNYGVCSEDFESSGAKVAGVVVRELCTTPSNWRMEKSLDEFMKEEGIPGISGIDTRMLTRKIRNYGTVKARISFYEEEMPDIEQLINDTQKQPDINKLNLVERVSSKKVMEYQGKSPAIAVIDCGIKRSILNNLLSTGASVIVFPYSAGYKEILAINPDGVLVSNGPGDPSLLEETIQNVKKLMECLPVYGICLGHQIVCLAAGAKTYKLKFGHRGINHPVLDTESGRVYITSQNHGFAVESASLKEFEITQISLYDRTIEGVRHKSLPVKAVQYHPEAGPGPHDACGFFKDFINNLR